MSEIEKATRALDASNRRKAMAAFRLAIAMAAEGQTDDSDDPTSCMNPEPARLSRQLDRMMNGGAR